MDQSASTPPLPQATCEAAGKLHNEYGRTHIKFNCPKCGLPWAISGPGLFPCHCGALIKVTAPGA